MERKRGLWLIDGGYLLKAQKSVGSEYAFDYRKLRLKLEADGPIWKAYYLNATPNPPSDAQNAFHSWLRSADGPKIMTQLYQLKRIDLRRAFCESCEKLVTPKCPQSSTSPHAMHKEQQKGVDVGLATLALVLADRYDTLILSSGDGDLLDAVKHLAEQGAKNIELVVFRHGVSTELQSYADRIYWINDFSDEVARDRRIADEPEALADEEE